jgi:hypothetical protein
MPRTSRKFLTAMLVAAVAGVGTPASDAFAKRPRKAAKSSKPVATQPAHSEVEASGGDSTSPPPKTTASADRTTPSPKPRVYTFSGMDVNGNMKAPQLLFFRGRVKQELDTSSPEKRSFLKELEKTADAKGL